MLRAFPQRWPSLIDSANTSTALWKSPAWMWAIPRLFRTHPRLDERPTVRQPCAAFVNAATAPGTSPRMVSNCPSVDRASNSSGRMPPASHCSIVCLRSRSARPSSRVTERSISARWNVSSVPTAGQSRLSTRRSSAASFSSWSYFPRRRSDRIRASCACTRAAPEIPGSSRTAFESARPWWARSLCAKTRARIANSSGRRSSISSGTFWSARQRRENEPCRISSEPCSSISAASASGSSASRASSIASARRPAFRDMPISAVMLDSYCSRAVPL